MPRRAVAPEARRVAQEVLVRVDTTAAFADVLLAARLAGTALPAADHALATRLVYGTLAWQGRLDHHLRALVQMPLERLDPPVRAALRLGLYQLLFLDRIPAHAAVDTSVRLARDAGRGAAGLVNAVLRRAARAGRDGLSLPDPARDPLGRLAVEWSHPRWLVERWAAELGPDELPALLAAHNEPAGTALRVNRRRTTPAALAAELGAAGLYAVPGRWAPDALVVRHGGAALRALPAWRNGAFTFQGEAAQLVTALLALAPGQTVLDACAAPGGKTLHAAALVGDGGSTVAMDRRCAPLRRLGVEAARLGVGRIARVAGDAATPPLRASFDAVLVDAPCSGLGTLARHPELRWRRTAADVPRLATLQERLLAGVAPLVRPGGVLVYAVCTITGEETTGVVAAFRSRAPHFVPESAAAHVPVELVTADGHLRTLPHRHGVDGFFAARFRAPASLDSPGPVR
jgi:16S rRNA (cytosine967-C5)-methyltransferase